MKYQIYTMLPVKAFKGEVKTETLQKALDLTERWGLGETVRLDRDYAKGDVIVIDGITFKVDFVVHIYKDNDMIDVVRELHLSVNMW